MLGVPAVHHLLGPILERDVLELADDAVSPMWRSFGRDTPGYAGVYHDLTIQICPPSLESRAPPAGEVMSLRPAPLPEPPTSTPPRPVVYVTFGTFFNANLEVFGPVLEGLAAEPVDVIATVGRDQDPAALAPLPPNIRVERFIPQAALLPNCASVIHHGGAGTTFGALAHGLPQVVIPQGADNFTHADMLERAGAAVVLHPGEVSPPSVAAALRRILDESSYAEAARRAANEIDAMPDANEVATALRAFSISRSELPPAR